MLCNRTICFMSHKNLCSILKTFNLKNCYIMDGKEEIVYKLLCMACLCVGRSLKKITDLKIKQYYLEALNGIPISNVLETGPIVCWECNAMLKKVVAFREQVKDSYRILQTYAHVNLHECLATDVIRPPRLTIQVTEPISITAEVCSEHNTRGEQVYVKEELKIDWDDDDRDYQDAFVADFKTEDRTSHHFVPAEKEIDAEIEAYIGNIKKGKKRRKKLDVKAKKAKRVVNNLKNDKKRLKRSKLQNEQKILTIELSYEEMLKEREKESVRDSYVKSEYKCQDCLIGFNYSKSYKTHLDNKHSLELGNYSCPICKTVISSVESFTAHYKRHMKRYQCSICNKRTMDLKVMQQHYYSTHEISLKDYKCNLCGKISNSIDTHRYHRDSHKARVACSDCDKTFSHRAGLMNHRLAVHELQNEFPCEVCGKVFRWKTSLKRHLEKHDAKSKSNEKAAAYCSQCGVSFSSVCSYQRHMKNSLKHVTQEQLRFICDECGRRFADKTKLRDHIEEKHLHKTYECHICHKPSKNRVGLDQHIRNVHKGRPNNKMCHHCGRGFPTKVQLESHIRTHTGERPFICEFCPTTFSQQSNLYKHNRQVHLNMKSKRSSCKKKEEKVESASCEVAPDGEASYNRAFTITLFRDGFCESLPDPRVTSVL